MKKISRFAALFVFVALFAVPLPASAACPVGYTPDLNNSANCIPNSPTYGAGPQIVPNTSSQSGGVNETYLRLYYDLVLTVVNSYLVPILIAISFIVFLWGVFNYFIYGASDETKRKEGRQFVMWGIIGLVIIFSTWALVNIVKGTLFPTTVQNTAPTPPRL